MRILCGNASNKVVDLVICGGNRKCIGDNSQNEAHEKSASCESGEPSLLQSRRTGVAAQSKFVDGLAGGALDCIGLTNQNN
jgi:hypothetical protein